MPNGLMVERKLVQKSSSFDMELLTKKTFNCKHNDCCITKALNIRYRISLFNIYIFETCKPFDVDRNMILEMP